MVRPPRARRLRRVYENSAYPRILLRFEDGHEIALEKGQKKAFDAYFGETIKIVVVWDPAAGDREVLAVLKAEQLKEEK